MIYNYFKIAYRNLLKYKTYSAINILGLAIGIASCILILLFVQDELSYDEFHKDSDRIYRITREWLNEDGESNLHLARVAPPIGPLLENDFPADIEDVVRFYYNSGTLIKKDEKVLTNENLIWAEENFFDFFSFSLYHGDVETMLKEPGTVVLSETTAKKLFGSTDVLGETVKLHLSNEFHDFTITGVCEDVPSNSHYTFDMVASFVTLENYMGREDMMQNWGSNNYPTYIRFSEGTDIEAFKQKLPEFLDRHLAPVARERWGLTDYVPSETNILHLMNITDIHLHSHISSELDINGDIDDVYLFGAIAFFILLIACINFMNLSTARSARRASEIGMRKVLGAQKRQLVYQFLGESIFITIIALLIAFLFVEIVLPYFNQFVGKELVFLQDGSLTQAFIFFIFALVIGVIAGSYPAIHLSSFRPIKALKSKQTAISGGSMLRKVLVTFQFAISITLIVGLGVISQQMDYWQTKELGLNNQDIILSYMNDTMVEKRDEVKTRLTQNQNILTVTTNKYIPSQMLLDSWGGRTISGEESKPISFRLAAISCDYDFVDTYELEIATGRNFSKQFGTDDSAAFILNETAVEKLGWNNESAIGKPFMYGDRKGEIVGVLKDFHFESLHNKIQPMILFITNDRNSWASIKTTGEDQQATIAFIESIWREYRPEYPFDYFYSDELFAENYDSEQKLTEIFGIFSTLAIIIACLGLLGLSAYMAEQRTKEIGIRKVLGASVSSVVTLLSAEFIKLVLIANLTAYPIAWFLMNKWLENYPYHDSINIGIFVLASVIALAIAVGTVSVQAIKAAIANPIKSIQYE